MDCRPGLIAGGRDRPSIASASNARIDQAIAGCILLCLGLQAWLAIATEINWDEFYFLSQIYEYQRGELTKAPQTFHVHLLGWLTGIGGWEVRQVEAGRLVMLLCEGVTSALIYGLARIFFNRATSLLAVLAYVSAGVTMIHGASFRTDPLAAMLAMSALLVVARAPLVLASAAAAACLAALAALVTVKVIFFAPAFAALAAWRWSREADRRRFAGWLAAAGVGAALIAGVLYLLHLSALPAASNAAAGEMMSGAARTTIIEGRFLRRGPEILRWALGSPVQTAMLLLGAGGALVASARTRSPNRLVSVVALACAAPLLSLLVYRNAFPYFLAFILPPAMLLLAWPFDRWPRLRDHLLPLALGMTVMAAMVAQQWSRRDQRAQQQLITQVHRIFPEPVAYIDRNSMIASFPKRGIFMSTWGIKNYLRGTPIFAGLLAKETVPLLVVNRAILQQALGLESDEPIVDLLPDDRTVLRANFIPHWGPIWVAGKTLRTGPEPRSIWIAIPGTYTLEGAAAEVDGRLLRVNETVHLGRGRHVLRSPVPARVTLRWGDHLYRPSVEPLPGPLYHGL